MKNNTMQSPFNFTKPTDVISPIKKTKLGIIFNDQGNCPGCKYPKEYLIRKEGTVPIIKLCGTTIIIKFRHFTF